jgi:hypothetical protein
MEWTKIAMCVPAGIIGNIRSYFIEFRILTITTQN